MKSHEKQLGAFGRRLSEFSFPLSRPDSKPPSIEKSRAKDRYFFQKKFTPSELKSKNASQNSNFPFFLPPKKKTEGQKTLNLTFGMASLLPNYIKKSASVKKRSQPKIEPHSNKDAELKARLASGICSLRIDKLKQNQHENAKEVNEFEVARILTKDLEQFMPDLPLNKSQRKEVLAKKFAMYFNYIETCEASTGKPMKNLRAIMKQAQNKISAKTFQDRANQTDVQINSFSLMNLMREYAMSLVKCKGKREFSVNDFVDLLESKDIRLNELDFEMQKLIKVYVDVMQKQIVFDNLLKVLELENFEAENNLVKAFHNFFSESRAEEQNLKTQKKPTMGIDLRAVTESKGKDQTPKGFHQEFMDLLPEFSLSWRMQAKKDLQKFNK